MFKDSKLSLKQKSSNIHLKKNYKYVIIILMYINMVVYYKCIFMTLIVTNCKYNILYVLIYIISFLIKNIFISKIMFRLPLTNNGLL